jgi:hypothetical protein
MQIEDPHSALLAVRAARLSFTDKAPLCVLRAGRRKPHSDKPTSRDLAAIVDSAQRSGLMVYSATFRIPHYVLVGPERASRVLRHTALLSLQRCQVICEVPNPIMHSTFAIPIDCLKDRSPRRHVR